MFLANVIKYKKNNGNLYVIGENGYAVIYLKEKIFCKVFLWKKNDIYENRQEFEIPSLVYILKIFLMSFQNLKLIILVN